MCVSLHLECAFDLTSLSVIADFAFLCFLVLLLGCLFLALRFVCREHDCWPSRSSYSIEDPFETSYDVAHPLRTASDRYFRIELGRAHAILLKASNQQSELSRLALLSERAAS